MKKIFFNLIKSPRSHLLLLSLLLVLLFAQSQFQPSDEYTYYLEFAKKLVAGQLDFSLPGFHGADFFTAIIYFITRSEYSGIYTDIIFAVISVLAFYLTAKEVFKSKKIGIYAAYIYVLNPLDYTNALRGHHHTPFIFFTLLGVYLLFKKSQWSWLAMGLTYIIRPFSVALVPVFWQQKKMRQFFLSLTVPAVYIIIEVLQTGRIFIGAHSDLTPSTLFTPSRLILNLGYAFQNYFSIHNFSFLHNLPLADMIHLSPFITFLVIVGILYPARYYGDKKSFFPLLISAVLALVIPASFSYLDMWYLWTFNFCLILLALPVISALPRFIPIIVASFGFQFLYLFLAHVDSYWQFNNYILFYIFSLILAISFFYSLTYFKKTNENINCG